MGVPWRSRGGQVGVTWGSRGGHVGLTWGSRGGRWLSEDLPKKPCPHGIHMDSIWDSLRNVHMNASSFCPLFLMENQWVMTWK